MVTPSSFIVHRSSFIVHRFSVSFDRRAGSVARLRAMNEWEGGAGGGAVGAGVGCVSAEGRPTWAEIDLDALASNLRAVKRLVGAGTGVMCVVKGDAYGHGAAACARRLAAEGADWFAVALPEEGSELRRAGVEQPVLCLAGFWEGQAGLCVAEKLTPVVYSLEVAGALDRAAREAGVVAEAPARRAPRSRVGVRRAAARA
jgi:alanine racemase